MTHFLRSSSRVLVTAAALAGCCPPEAATAPAHPSSAGPRATADAAPCTPDPVRIVERLLDASAGGGGLIVGACQRGAFPDPRLVVVAWRYDPAEHELDPSSDRTRHVVVIDPGSAPPDTATIVARAEPVIDRGTNFGISLRPPVDIDGDGVPEIVGNTTYTESGLTDEGLLAWRIDHDRLRQIGGADIALGFAGYGATDCVADVTVRGDGVVTITRREIAGRLPHLDAPPREPCKPGPERYRLAGDAFTAEPAAAR